MNACYECIRLVINACCEHLFRLHKACYECMLWMHQTCYECLSWMHQVLWSINSNLTHQARTLGWERASDFAIEERARRCQLEERITSEHRANEEQTSLRLPFGEWHSTGSAPPGRHSPRQLPLEMLILKKEMLILFFSFLSSISSENQGSQFFRTIVLMTALKGKPLLVPGKSQFKHLSSHFTGLSTLSVSLSPR